MAKITHNSALYYFHEGTNFQSYRYFGCHQEKKGKSKTYSFRVWAPNARHVFVVGDFCDWHEGIAMTRISKNGVWELLYQTESDLQSHLYKFKIVTAAGQVKYKGDPYAFASKGGSDGASVICHESRFKWEDSAWLEDRKTKVCTSPQGHYLSAPVNIYEAHLPSILKHEDGSYYNYRSLADELAPYLKRMGYTHIEILPITEYPYDPSWGYQVCGYFAPTVRLGAPDDFRYFVNKMHTFGIGVIMDWVPAHFPKDDWGLYEFDGSKLYEYQGMDRMESRSWGTRFFDLGRQEVQCFLVSSAIYWVKEFHIDGLRVDAVASMLYLDYDRLPGEWIPNKNGGRENLEAIAFLQKLNQAVLSHSPDVMMIAEESSTFPLLTRPVSDGGLGFTLKWNMGWANDFFAYLKIDPIYRKHHHKALNFPIMYAFDENYVLPISHDEVVHGKHSFLDKMNGTHEEKCRQFRAALLFMMTFPGKKMLFMGTEYGQYVEWNFDRSLEWFMLNFPDHRQLQQYVMSLNHFYLSHSPLWAMDFDREGFSWIDPNNADQNLVSYRRFDENGREMIVAITFSGSTAENVVLPTTKGQKYKLVFESSPGSVRSETKAQTKDTPAHLLCSLAPFSGAVWLAEDLRGEPLQFDIPKK